MALAYLLRYQGERDEAEAVARQAAARGNLEAVGAAACWAYDRTLDPGLEADLRRGPRTTRRRGRTWRTTPDAATRRYGS